MTVVKGTKLYASDPVRLTLAAHVSFCDFDTVLICMLTVVHVLLKSLSGYSLSGSTLLPVSLITF